MDYPCAKFGDSSFSHFGFYHANRQTESQNIRSHTYTDTMTVSIADDCYTHVTCVGVSRYYCGKRVQYSRSEVLQECTIQI